MVNFPTRITDLTAIPDCPTPLDLFISSESSTCSAMTFSSLGNSDNFVSVSIKVPSNSQRRAPAHHIAYDSRADWDGLSKKWAIQ